MKFVAIGGGHGTAVTLRALRGIDDDVTGIVTVGDDGGSTGRLRAMLNVAAVGDLRKCLGALADPHHPLTQAFEHRFTVGELAGHTVGNLFLVGLIDATGDLEASVDAAAQALGVTGTIVPASRQGVVLLASHDRGVTRGQTAVARTPDIHLLSLDPPSPPAPSRALRALEEADVIVIGPGSLYTSVLAACVVPAINRALALSRARKIYVANLRPEDPETLNFTLQDHVDALRAHGVEPTDVLVDQASQFATQTCRIDTRVVNLTTRNPLVHDVPKLRQAVIDACDIQPPRDF
ncbi:MAG: YvcK family protein [Acidobacteria bacterium]|nr:YvcK family protein [Acidobacteriota bacterium]